MGDPQVSETGISEVNITSVLHRFMRHTFAVASDSGLGPGWFFELMLDDLHMSHPLSYRLVSTFCSQDVDTEDLKSPISREIFEPAKIINGTHIYIHIYIYMYVCVYVNLFHCMICFEQPLQVPEMLQDMSIECVSGVFWI